MKNVLHNSLTLTLRTDLWSLEWGGIYQKCKIFPAERRRLAMKIYCSFLEMLVCRINGNNDDDDHDDDNNNSTNV